MKCTLILFFSLLIMSVTLSTYAQDKKSNSAVKVAAEKVEAYYFHLTARCVTCKAVESEAKSDIEKLYGDKISFQSINLDDASSKAISEKLQVSGQALLLVKGKQILNITNEGFMYARTDPEKFKAVIKEKIDGLLK